VRYIVYGAGGIGGTIGGRLHQHGHEVVLIARGAHAAAIRSAGLRLEDPERSATLRLPVVSNPLELTYSSDDVVIISTKGQDTPSACTQLAAAASGADISVVAAQNGVDNERILARRFRHVYGMQVILAASHLEPGVVLCHRAPFSGVLGMGRFPTGVDARAVAIAHDLATSGFRSDALPDVTRHKYRKLVSNLSNVIEAVCAPGDDSRNGTLATLVRAEAMAVFAAAGIDVATIEEDRARRRDGMELRAVGAIEYEGSSSWQSLQRRTGHIETDQLNGEIVLLGRLHGVPTPVNEALQCIANELANRNEGPGHMSEDEVLAWSTRR
jgi:2-dehydropantoate 2-reductase